MKKFIVSILFSLTVIAIGACTQSSSSQANTPVNPNYKVKRVSDVNDYSMFRFVDCEALTVSYITGSSGISTNSLSPTQIGKLCP